MTNLRWGILATGWIAELFVSDMHLAGLNVVAVGSRSQEAADEFAKRFSVPRAHGSYEALVADPEVDIVYVATPHPLHADNAILALEHGKHVLVEKAFTLNAAQARQVREVAQAKNLLVMEAMWTRYLPHMKRIHEILDTGTLGTIRALEIDHSQALSTDPLHRVSNLELGGGSLLDIGIYPVSFTWDVLGTPDQIVASATIRETGADAEVATIFRYGNDAIAISQSSSRGAGPNTASLIGELARIDIDKTWYEPTSFRVVGRDGTIWEEYVSEVEGRGMQYQAMAMEDYLRAGKRDSDLLPIDETIAIMESLDEIRRQIGLRYPSE